MVITPPTYVSVINLQSAPLTYVWDDENAGEVYLRPDERLGAKINAIADRAEVALALGMAEWVAWRLHRLLPETNLIDLIEAIWAGIIDWRYISGVDGLSRKEWSGQIRGPIRIVFNQLIEVVRLVASKQFAHPEIVCISKVAEYVTPDKLAFRTWRRQVMSRLTSLYPKSKRDFWGDPVPRPALEPSNGYKLEEAKPLLNEFLNSLDPISNPYLSRPEQLKTAGFRGVPYRVM